MKNFCVGLYFSLLTALFLHEVGSVKITVLIPSGQEECFFEKTSEGETLLLHYYVVHSKSTRRINVFVYNDRGASIITDMFEEEGSHEIKVATSDTLKICFDTSDSKLGFKTLYFSLTRDDERNHTRCGAKHGKCSLQDYKEEVNQINESVRKIDQNMHIISDKLEIKRLKEARDRNMAEYTFEIVNMMSAAILIMVPVLSILQVIALKSFFDEKYDIKVILFGTRTRRGLLNKYR